MRFQRSRPLLAIVLSLGLGVSCSSSELGPNETPLSPDVTSIIAIPTIVTNDLLDCSPQRYLSVSKVVGPKGGKIRVGSHSLDIPTGALAQDVTITAEQVTGTTNSVRFSPEGLTFARPAELTMGYDNCSSVAAPKSIVYTTERLSILQQLKSDDKVQSKIVVSPIEHFSRYAVAY